MTTFTTRECFLCGKRSEVEVTEAEYKAYVVDRGLVQEVFADRTAAERELLVSGTHPACWAELFPNGEE